MGKVKNLIFSRCRFFDNHPPNLEAGILPANINWFSGAIDRENSRLICLHRNTKTLTFLCALLLGIDCYQREERSAKEILESLAIGQAVIYKRSRGVFQGFNEKGYAVVDSSNKLRNLVPPPLFYEVKPYFGKAKTYDGRGISKELIGKRAVLAELLGVEKSEIPAKVLHSVVVVASRLVADQIASQTIRVNLTQDKQAKLCEVIPASYFSGGEEYPYPGNTSKGRPLLKFAKNISVARDLIFENTDNETNGLIVSGRRFVETGFSELESLFQRRSLSHVWILDNIGGWSALPFIENNEEAKLFAWTNRALAFHNDKMLGTDVSIIEMPGPVEYFDGQALRYQLHQLLKTVRAQHDLEEMGEFIRGAWSLLRIMTCALFPLEYLENQMSTNPMFPFSLKQRIDKLRDIACNADGNIAELLASIVAHLTSLYEFLFTRNPKADYFYEHLQQNAEDSSITVVVPKRYFSEVFYSWMAKKGVRVCQNIEFITPSQFDLDKHNEAIVISGVTSQSGLNPYNLHFPGQVCVLAYDHERKLLSNMRTQSQKETRQYDRINLALSNTERETIIEEEVQPGAAEQLDIAIDKDLEGYLIEAFQRTAEGFLGAGGSAEGQSSVIVSKIAVFESGEIAFLSKHYNTYCLDIESGEVTEKSTSEIEPGDNIIFRASGSETRDIVDEIMVSLLESDKSPPELENQYRQSQRWKDILRDYMDANGLSYKKIAEKMSELGSPKTSVTVRAWLDDGSHIVGPREEKAYEAIATLTNNQEMLSDSKSFWASCDVIRKIRIRILKHIGISIISAYGKQSVSSEDWISSIIGDVSQLAVVLQVETIFSPTEERAIPGSQANRPLDAS